LLSALVFRRGVIDDSISGGTSPRFSTATAAMATASLRRRNLERRKPPAIQAEHLIGFAVVLGIWTGYLIQIYHLLAPACSPTTFAKCREGR
jgi:hypothetical protein